MTTADPSPASAAGLSPATADPSSAAAGPSSTTGPSPASSADPSPATAADPSPPAAPRPQPPQPDSVARKQLAGRPLLRVIYSAKDIERRVSELGREIASAYPPEADILVLALMKGSFIFVADLVRRIPRPIQFDFVAAGSYGDQRTSSGRLNLLYMPEKSLEGRNVVLVEDIVDSGLTMERLAPLLRGRRPASLDICALLHKRRKGVSVEPRWVGFDAPDEYLVGYGLDYAEEFRHLSCIGSI